MAETIDYASNLLKQEKTGKESRRQKYLLQQLKLYVQLTGDEATTIQRFFTVDK